MLALGLCLPWTAFSASSAEAEPPKIMGVRVGLADDYKVGLWTQVEVTLLGGSEPVAGKVAVIVSDSDGVPTRVSEAHSREIQPGRETTVRLLTRFGRVDGNLTVEFQGDSGTLARRTFTASSRADGEHFLYGMESQKLLLAVGPSAFDIGELDKMRGIEPQLRHVVAQLNDVEHLPLEWIAYEGVDTIFLFTSQPKIYDRLAGDDVRQRALEQWIRMGGRLILCVGSHGNEVLTGQSPLLRFVKGRFERTAPLKQTQTNALENYCGSSTARLAPGDAQSGLRVPKLTAVQGVVEAQDGDLPLVIRTAWGFGQVVFVAADLDEPPLSRWSDRALLLAKLLDMPAARADESDEKAAIMHFGYNDLAGQLRSALEQFTGVEAVSFSLVAGLIVLYVLLIGPGDYFFLRKVVRRMTWTWLTFPLLVVLASVVRVLPRARSQGRSVPRERGRPRRRRRLVGVGSRHHVGQCLQPAVEDVPVRATAEAARRQAAVGDPRVVVVVWAARRRAGRHESAHGRSVAMDATLRFLGQPGCHVWRADPGRLDQEPHRALVRLGRRAAARRPYRRRAESLYGKLTNPFDFPLEQCMLAYGNSGYELGTIEKNGSAQVGAESKRSELKTLLTGVVVTRARDKYRTESTPYDQSSTDISYVLRMMMFHDAAGGRRYTGLLNEYQSFVDLNPLLKTDRAILVAQGRPTPSRRATAPSWSSEENRWHVRRISTSPCIALYFRSEGYGRPSGAAGVKGRPPRRL